MTWAEGHPPHWCAEIESLGYNRPPANHKFVTGACVFCGHPDPLTVPIGNCEHGKPIHYAYPCEQCTSALEPRPEAGGCVE